MPRNFIISFIDRFYPPFRKFVNLQTFRYLACGGSNTLLDIALYWTTYNYIFTADVLHVGPVAIGREIVAFIVAFTVSFPLGFWLMRSIVFTDSTLRGRVQLFRYFMLVAVCIILNYAFLKLFVTQWGIYAPLAKVFTTVIVVSFSYLTQKNYTFRSKKGIQEI